MARKGIVTTPGRSICRFCGYSVRPIIPRGAKESVYPTHRLYDGTGWRYCEGSRQQVTIPTSR
jgi:hypothetical protein